MPDKCPEGIEEKLWQEWHDLKRDDVIWLAQYNHVSIDPKANKGPIIEKLIRSKTDLPTPAEFAKLKGAVTAHQDHTHASRLAQWNKVPDSLLTTAIWVLCKERLPKFYRMKPDQARDVLACQFDALNPEILTTITPPADLKTYTNSHPQHVAPNTSAPTSTTSDQAAEAKKKVTSDIDEVDPPQSPADDDEGGALQTGPLVPVVTQPQHPTLKDYLQRNPAFNTSHAPLPQRPKRKTKHQRSRRALPGTGQDGAHLDGSLTRRAKTKRTKIKPYDSEADSPPVIHPPTKMTNPFKSAEPGTDTEQDTIPGYHPTRNIHSRKSKLECMSS